MRAAWVQIPLSPPKAWKIVRFPGFFFCLLFCCWLYIYRCLLTFISLYSTHYSTQLKNGYQSFLVSLSTASRASLSSGCAYLDSMAVVDQRMIFRTVSGAIFSSIAKAVAVVCLQEYGVSLRTPAISRAL